MWIWLATLSTAATAEADRDAVARMVDGNTEGLTSLYDRRTVRSFRRSTALILLLPHFFV